MEVEYILDKSFLLRILNLLSIVLKLKIVVTLIALVLVPGLIFLPIETVGVALVVVSGVALVVVSGVAPVLISVKYIFKRQLSTKSTDHESKRTVHF